MEKSIRKFLEFNGKTIYFLSKDGNYWVAIKPICEALNLEYTRQFKNVKEDKILGAALAKQPMQVGSDQVRNYACLPEFYLYGWLFSIHSSSEKLNEYKWECYRVLYEHFHGMITQREKLIGERLQAEMRLDKIEKTIAHLPEVQQINELKGKIFNINKNLKSLDVQTQQAQLSIFNQG